MYSIDDYEFISLTYLIAFVFLRIEICRFRRGKTILTLIEIESSRNLRVGELSASSIFTLV